MKNLPTILASALVLGGSVGIANAQDLSGFYAGGGLGLSHGGFGPNPAWGDFDGGNAQLFAGYNANLGNLVLGGELAAFLGHVTTDSVDNRLDSLTDLKLRAGTMLGSALVYALAGVSFGTSTSYGVGYDFSGVNYGIGMDYAVSDRLFVGAEIVARNIDDGGSYLDTRPMTTASIRAGFRF